MSSFDEKWKETAKAARKAEPDIPMLPLGFATRVVALSREAVGPVMTWLTSFERYVFKAMAVVALAACVTGGLVANELMEPPSIVPALEDEVAEQFPLL
jgi:hypothetical protein